MVLTYVKIAAAVLLLGLVFWLGGLPGKATIASLKAQQQTQITEALRNQAASKQAEIDRINKVLYAYQNTPIDPINIGLATRVYKYAVANCDALPQAAALARGISQPAAVSASDQELIGLAQQAINACASDARQLTAIQQAWPR